jgi:hypothetical protein
VEAAREVPVTDGIIATIRTPGLRLFVLVLAPSSGVVGGDIVAAASALRPSLLQFGDPERRSLSPLLERVAVGDQEPCRPAGPPVWGVVRTRGGETGVPFVMAP